MSKKRKQKQNSTSGRIEKHSSQKAKKTDLKVIGELRLHPDGYGFVIGGKTGQEDVFVPARYIGDAFHTDLVEASVEVGRKGLFEGRILRVVERRVKRLVGRLEQVGKIFRVVTDDKRVKHAIEIPKDKLFKAVSGDNVVAKITKYPHEGETMFGEVVEVLATRGAESTEERAVVIKHQLRDVFPKNVLELAEEKNIGWHSEIPLRKDLRSLPLVTIDGESARDFDDAVYVERNNNGYRLFVSIADVSFFVHPNDLIDSEAFERSTSVYFPKFCIPMLPEVLSNDLCSLVPNEDRLTMTAEISFSSSGDVTSSKFYPSVIKSKARLTYTQVKKLLVDHDEEVEKKLGDVATNLRLMEELFNQLRKRRLERGSIDFDLPEPEIVLDVEGEIDDIIKSQRHVGHMIIEEFMIAANEAVARFLTEKKRGCIYRVHERPQTKKLNEFSKLLHNLGYKVHFSSEIEPMDLAKIVGMVHGKPEERLVNHKMLRSMPQAVYSPENMGHFGLASSCYCHFTSPIRRYPDLVVHRLLKYVLKENRSPKTDHQKANLIEISEHCSRRERIAMEAEREILKLHSALFMKDHVGEIFDGIISFVAKFGFFVQLQEYFIEGLVPIDSLKGEKYQFQVESGAIVGKRNSQKFQIGDSVKIKVESVKIPEREILFTLNVD
ncbi:MAG: ribonuclease R [Pseudomonadota bacterium]